MRLTLLCCFCFFLLWQPSGSAQKVDNQKLSVLVKQYKSEAKGPYKDIRWFCKDGTTVPGTERCSEPGGVQRARYKDEVLNLARTNHLFLGQILSLTPYPDFWDTAFGQSRLKQYQIERFLQLNDNGWILRKAQYYRGAYQVEDEEAWGAAFLSWLLTDDQAVRKNFFLIRQAVRDIPHLENNPQSQKIRAISKEISDSVPSFMNIRVKIHGQPDISDIQRVEAYKESHGRGLRSGQMNKLDLLISQMRSFYKPQDIHALKKFISGLPGNSELRTTLTGGIDKLSELEPGVDRVIDMTGMLWIIRDQLISSSYAKSRLSLMDLSIALEEQIFKDISLWDPETVESLLLKTKTLSRASAGCGFLETWEWERISAHLVLPSGKTITSHQLANFLESARRVVEWSTAMLRSTYETDVELFQGFEPLAYGFLDDRTRSSLLLPLGQSVGELTLFLASVTGMSNDIMGLKNTSQVRGLNPGYAFGELEVVTGQGDDIEVSNDNIYIFNRPPADLKPIAGIATVSEGNLVSHVQLLARNLGIPNAVISLENLAELKKYNGQTVFYAVSDKGSVIMKPDSMMTDIERKLFEKKSRNDEKITVPVSQMDLSQTGVLNLRDVHAIHSGQLCGPKAANLGQLKLLFPENVVEGIVIPFGIFREHMDQLMPEKNISYWDFLNQTFTRAISMYENGMSEHEIEMFTLSQLEELRAAIRTMPLLPAFVKKLRQSFREVLGQLLGSIPVFLRSDTNMEDLKDFTGAGLNLTLFNVFSEEKILQGIKDVWASPYTERSYKWRQRFLLNPENVYPSILIIPSVNVDYSGVMITKGIGSGTSDDLTIAFSRGAGGAVEGQEAESHLLSVREGNTLLSPARETFFTVLPQTGGVEKRRTTFESPILSGENLLQLQEMAGQINEQFTHSAEGKITDVYDIELGFRNNKLWLFQVRPFVENKKALSSTYLKSMTPEIPDFTIPLSEPLNINNHEN